MNIVFLCYAVNPDCTTRYSGVSVAGNKMQTSIIKYISAFPDVNLRVISIRPVASYPADKHLFYYKNTSQIFGITSVETGFINCPVIKQISQSRSCFNELKKELKDLNPTDTVILSFNMYPQTGIPLTKAMKMGYVTVPLIADLPIDYSVNRGILGKKTYEAYNNKTKRLIKKQKHVIVLNRKAAELYAPDADFIVVDGGIDLSDSNDYHTPEKASYAEKNLVYCGSLHRYSGALTLVKAFTTLQIPDLYLDIYGDGEDKNAIIEISKKDFRVRYHGVVDNKTILQRQKEAFLLVNPRPINDPISEVTFPSKIFEYMISGTPILSTRLKGFSSEYDDKLLFVEDTVEGIANGIKNAYKMNDDILLEYARRSSQFIVESRNWKKQSEKIQKYLGNCLNTKRKEEK